MNQSSSKIRAVQSLLSTIMLSSTTALAGGPVVVYEATGVVDSLFGNSGDFEIGQPFSFTLTCDLAQASADQNPSGNAGIYSFDTGYDFALSVPDANFDAVFDYGLITLFQDASTPPIDSLSFNVASNTILTNIRDNDAIALSSDDIPLALPPISEFEETMFTYAPPGNVPRFGGSFTSITVTVVQPCSADFTGDGILDAFDVFEFIEAFNANDSSADFSPDGVIDIFDVFAFVDAFNAGCP